jgi:Zn-dependent protease with chaperone function
MRYLLSLLTSLVVAAAAAAGPAPVATLVVMDAGDGSVSVYLTVVSPHLPGAERSADLRDALVEAFAPSPDRIYPNLAPGVWSFSVSIPEPTGERSIDLTGILAELKAVKQDTLKVTAMLPDVVGMECNLSPVQSRMPGTRWYEDEFHTDDPANEIIFTFPPPPPPREPGDPVWLLSLLAVPLPIFAWAWLVRRRAALSHDDATPLADSYWRFHQLHLLPTIVLWLAAFSLFDVGPFVAGWFPGDTAGVRLLRWTALYALPPAVIALLAQAIVRPALTKLQALGWPGVEILRQSASLHLLPHAALLCGVCGIATLYETGNMYTGVALPFIGLVIYFVYGWLLRRALVLTPNAISTGEVQDRVTELARQFRVPVPLVSMLPSGRTEIANAFAVPGKGVWLSESLLRNFSRKEVDAIVAHELAHFRQFRRRRSATQRGPAFWLFYVMLVVAGMMWLLSNPAFAYGTGSRPMDFSRWAPLAIGSLLVGIRLTVSSSKRHNEYEADLHAVEVTGEPAALITALTRLHRIGGTPLSWTRFEELFYTHPATTRRIAALARRGGLRRAEVAELVCDTEADGDRYSVPSTAIAGNVVFSSAFRSSYMTRMSWTIIAIEVVIPVIAALLAQVLAEPGYAQIAVLTAGAVVTVIAYFAFVRQFRAAAQARLRHGLREKFRRQEGDPEVAGGTFVNFAPGDVPKLHECFGQWDIGYLFLGDRLVYIGEQVRLALRPDQITDLRHGQGLPGWTLRDHIYLTWRDPSTGRAGTFRLWPGEISSDVYAIDIHRFEERLHAWRAGKVTGPTPDAYASLGPPELGEVHGVRPRTVGKAQSFLYALMFYQVLSAGLCVLLGLSFDPGELAGAWYVLAVVAVVLVINILPYWLAKDPEPPAVTAAPPTP